MSQTDLLPGPNIDHVATLGRARGTQYPVPLHAVPRIEHAVGKCKCLMHESRL